MSFEPGANLGRSPPVFFHNVFQYAGKSFEKQSLEKKSGQRVFCGNNKKVSAKDFLEADDINKKKVSVWWNSPDV